MTRTTTIRWPTPRWSWAALLSAATLALPVSGSFPARAAKEERSPARDLAMQLKPEPGPPPRLGASSTPAEAEPEPPRPVAALPKPQPTTPAATVQTKSESPSAPIPNLKEEVNSIGMKMVLIPAGEFMMGSLRSEGYSDEQPQHRARITRPFYLGAYEVTVGQFGQFVKKSRYMAAGDAWKTTSLTQSDKHPAVRVNWHDATAFCHWLSEKEGRTYRLPTEAEWEYACRAGSTTKYCFGDGESELRDYAWYNANANRRTHPVGQKKPNAWGLYDMHGNAMEWCADWYDPKYYASSPPDDPSGPSSGASRVLRGGSWVVVPNDARSAHRRGLTPGYRGVVTGFRVARIR